MTPESRLLSFSTRQISPETLHFDALRRRAQAAEVGHFRRAEKTECGQKAGKNAF
jgi:hypothetical protein